MSNNQQIIDAPSERTIRTRTVKYSGYVIETTVEEYELNENHRADPRPSWKCPAPSLWRSSTTTTNC